ncbi:MAG: pyrrolysine--tRNA(Pyl) ligase large subunit [Clostridia bacterium]|nr:pyrrolysine--tRNA(Pyl) ligase large subunit [Clostridia bacterium]
MVSFTTTQKERLAELSADESLSNLEFETERERNLFFQNAEKEWVKKSRENIWDLLHEKHEPILLTTQRLLENWLKEKEKFTQVSTPSIITGDMLKKMNINEDSDLLDQVFWLGNNKCLRPMLAPNLYVMMRELKRISGEPVKIFECGSCFRKESQGAQHLNEFTMLNMVELAATEEGKQAETLEYYAHEAMKAVGIDRYELIREESVVYKETIDIVVDGLEVASGAYGPMYLDGRWGVFDVWVGIGFGVERLAAIMGGFKNIRRTGKSITYINGVPLNI